MTINYFHIQIKSLNFSDRNVDVAEEEIDVTSHKNKEKPLYLKDYVREKVLNDPKALQGEDEDIQIESNVEQDKR